MQRLDLMHMRLQAAVFDWIIRTVKVAENLLGAVLLAMSAIMASTPVSIMAAAAGHAADSAGEGEDSFDALVTRGAYLATIGDCTGCHTARRGHPDFGGGLAINFPFGTIYSTDITPDLETGIGHYSYEDFNQAVRGMNIRYPV